jgi:predicted cobalt transporter CbtA
MLKRFDSARPRSVVAWAVLVGILAGLSAAVYHTIASEPLIDDAIAIEDARIAAEDHHAGGGGEPEQVSRSDQRGAGLFVGYALLGGAYALVLSVAALALRGDWLDPFRRVLVAGSILAAAITVVPWLKYPPNPPAVGDPATAGERQRLYWVLVALTGVVLAGAAHLSSRLRDRGWPDTRRIAAVAAAVALVLGVTLAVMPPSTDPIPTEVPATLIWRFRVASLGGNLLLWGLLTLGFGTLWAEAHARRQARAGATATSAAGEADAQNSMPFRAEMPSS